MKLHGEVLESNNPTEIPSFVKFRELPDGAESVNVIHHTKSNSAFFIGGNSYFVLTKNNADDHHHFSQVKPFSDIIGEAGHGNFMGF